MGAIINDRIDVRISKEQKELVKYASSLSGFKSLSEFIVFCISKESKIIIKENNEILKSLEDKKVFVDAIINPAEPNSKLKQAHKNYVNFLNEPNENRNTQ
ncbi:type II toxin-antitoxin system TacA family antitoxin [Elizabethkingia anophelis]|uniref:type II toxin-antitoxin system TacA family antitoxin n=1 Tax=Elizabethkingia anophelis TaxID=1117645 RepID=UPI0038914FD4